MFNNKAKSNNSNSNSDDVSYKNLNLKGTGFINKVRLVKKGSDLTLIAFLSLQHGKVVGNNYDDVVSTRFESICFDDDIKAALVDGMFPNVDKLDDGVYTVEPEKKLSGAFSFSGISRVDIVNNQPVILSPMIGCAFIAYDGEFVVDNRKNQQEG